MIDTTFLQFIGLTILCCYLVHYYSGPQVSFQVKFWSVLTWVLNFGMALLVPIDIYESRKNVENEAFQESPIYQRISLIYLVCYWTVYLLTWTIIPVLQQWENSGDLKSGDRLRRSLKTNGIFYLVLLVLGIIGLILLIFIGAADELSLTIYLKALAMAFGIFLLMIFMGYAMVEIPRSLWHQSNNKDYLLYCYKNVQQLEAQLIDAQFQFKKLISIITEARQKFKQKPEYLQYCQAALSQVPALLKPKIPIKPKLFLSQIGIVVDDNFNLEDLIQQHRLIKRNFALIRRLSKSIDQFVDRSILCQDVQSSRENAAKKIQTLLFKSTTLDWYWFINIKPLLKKAMAIVYAVFAFFLLVCETQVFLTQRSSLLSLILNFQNLSSQKIASFITIVLISYMVYYSLFRLKLSNLYGLYKKQSDGPSLMFATINFSRVGAALIINFFDMLKIQGIFTKSMNAPDMGLIGNWAIKGMPGVLWIIVLSHYFNFWGKLMAQLNIDGSMGFSDHSIADSKTAVPYLVSKRKLQLQKSMENRQLIV